MTNLTADFANCSQNKQRVFHMKRSKRFRFAHSINMTHR